MAERDLLLGIDVGTGGCKALLVDSRGEVIADATTEYPLSTPKALWSEQDPEHWWQATIAGITQVLAGANVEPGRIAGVGLTGQMHGLVLLDDGGEVLRPAILWNDQRCGEQCDEIHRRLGRDSVIRRTGKPVLTGFTAPKILWVRAHEPEVYRAVARVLLPKDFVRYRLTGTFLSDVTDASGTSLFDVGERRWSDEILEALQIPRAWLPEVTESPVASAAVSAAGACKTGLVEGTPVVAGAGDQAAEAVGCGVVEDGRVSITIGTSGVVFAATETCQLDLNGQLHSYCHAIPGMWHVMGVMLSAGGSLRWFRDTLGGEEITQAADRSIDPYDVLIEGASTIQPGCEGLLFLPYLTGERTPYADPNAREQHTKDRADRRQYRTLSHRLGDEVIATGSERRSHSDLLRASLRTNQEEVRHIRAGDEKHEADGRHENPQHGTNVPNDVVDIRAHPDVHAGLFDHLRREKRRELLRQTITERMQLNVGILTGRSRCQSCDRVEVDPPKTPSRIYVQRCPHAHVSVGEAEVGRHHAYNLEGGPVSLECASDHGRIGGERFGPIGMADDDNRGPSGQTFFFTEASTERR